MRLSRARIIVYAFILSILALWINNQQSGSKPSQTEHAKIQQSYSWQSSQSTAWQIDRQKPNEQTTIQTATWHYQEATQQSDFTQPVITLVKPEGTTTISSQNGQSLNDNIISLSGQVVISQMPNQDKPGQTQLSTLSTDKITYNISQGDLHSDDKITISQPTGITTGTGLNANLQSGYYHILSDVKGTYHIKSE